MLKNTRKTVTLRDVAAAAGIDKATASRALSGKGYMSQQTREAALRAAQELGFQPDLHAQRLANGRNHNMIVVLPVSDLGVATLQGWFIEHRLDELGYEVEIQSPPRWVNHFEERQVVAINKVRRQRPGAIVFHSLLEPQAVQELRHFIDEGGIVVGYGSEVDLHCDQVHFDESHRTYTAATHLLELGHRDIGFCLHGPVSFDGPEVTGFRRALANFNLPLREEWIFEGGNYEEGGAQLAEAFLNWPERPTGLCIINDVSASSFINVLARHGLNVPRDVSVVGFDDARAARYALVPISTVNYPLEEMGRHIVDFTQSRFAGYVGPPRQTVVKSQLVIRSSTAPPPRKECSKNNILSPSLLTPVEQSTFNLLTEGFATK